MGPGCLATDRSFRLARGTLLDLQDIEAPIKDEDATLLEERELSCGSLQLRFGVLMNFADKYIPTLWILRSTTSRELTTDFCIWEESDQNHKDHMRQMLADKDFFGRSICRDLNFSVFYLPSKWRFVFVVLIYNSVWVVFVWLSYPKQLGWFLCDFWVGSSTKASTHPSAAPYHSILQESCDVTLAARLKCWTEDWGRSTIHSYHGGSKPFPWFYDVVWGFARNWEELDTK